jgi:hypothetical protein
MVKNCISQVYLVYLAAWFSCIGLCNSRMTVTRELHRQWSWPNLKKCPSSFQEQLRKAWKFSSHDCRLIWKVAAQSSSYYSCNTSYYGHNHCQFGGIVRSGCMTSIGTLRCFAHRVTSATARRWSLTSVPLRCKPYWVCFGEKQQLILSCWSASEGKCPSSCTEWYWAIYVPAITVHNTSHVFTICIVLQLIPSDIRVFLN